MKKHHLAVLLACWASAPLTAQVVNGSILGTVTDPEGRPLVAAQVTAKDLARNGVRRVTVGVDGFYRFVGLEPGEYRVSAEAEQFAPAQADTVRVAVNGQERIDFQLQIPGAKQTLEVSARIQQVETIAGALSTVLDRTSIGSLPLNRRDFLQLALLTPGVLAAVEDSELSTRGGFAMHANGAREESNNFLLDGADNNDGNVNRFVLQPSVDAVQEFQIATNSYSAEFGRNAGGQVNVVTMRGGNDFHGALYEYLRNDALDARNYFAGSAAGHFRMNQTGGSLSGPVVRDRSFFFANFESLLQRQGYYRLAAVPPMEMRSGDFAQAGKVIADPFSRQPFPGNRIPASRLSPAGMRIAGLFPAPGISGAGGNYLGQPVGTEDRWTGIARFDQRLGARDELAVRYGDGWTSLFEPYGEEPGSVPGFGDFLRDRGSNLMAHHQRVVSSRTVQSLRFGFSRLDRRLTPESAGLDAVEYLAVPWLRPRPEEAGFPSFQVSGYARLGDITSLPIFRTSQSWQLLESLAMVRGAHTWKAGGEFRRVTLDSRLSLLTRGSLSFSGALSGLGLADLLLGLPSFGMQSRAENPQDLRYSTWAAYVQDDWRITPSLVLNAGLRYEYNTPPVDPAARMSTLDFAAMRLTPTGDGQRADRNNFAPRFGLAWTLAPDLVLRAGYGLFFDAGMTVVHSAQYFNPPQFTLRVYFPTAQWMPTLNDPFPSNAGLAPPASLSLLHPDLASSNLQHWNISLQRSFLGGVLSAAYAGSKGTHLIRSRDLNQPAPAEGPLALRRPYPAFGNILQIESAANSAYHSLQASWQRPLTRGFMLWSAYTWGKSIDEGSAFLPTRTDHNFPQNSYDAKAERALSSFDSTHRLVAAPVWLLPAVSRWTRHTELRAIFTAFTGRPFTPRLRFDNSNTGNTGGNFGSDRPDLLASPRLDDRSAERWFDIAALPVPDRYRFGTAGRNVVRGPAYVSFDVAAVRRIPLGDRVTLQLEAEAFNLLNRTNFDSPELYADDRATFGRIFSAKAARQLQFALRLTF